MPDIYVSGPKQKSPSLKPNSGEDLLHEAGADDQRSEHSLPGHRHGPFAAFSYMPDRINFETREEDEKVVLLLRRHIITNIPWILVAAVLILAPLVLNYFPLLLFLPERFQMVVTMFWYLIVMAFILEESLSWFFNVYLVTDERVIDVDFYNLIYKEISDAKIDKIQDVTYNTGGVVRTLFNYGDVMIQTAGTVTNFEFTAVPDPARVAKILQKLRTEEEREALEGRVR